MAYDSGLNALTESIILDARRQADEIIAEAHREAEQIINAARNEEVGSCQTQENASDSLGYEAFMEYKRYDMRLKRGIVEKAFSSAYEKLFSLDDESLYELFKAVILKEAEGGEVINPSSKHRRIIMMRLDEINRSLTAMGKRPLGVGVTSTLRNGFELVGVGYKKDCSFDSLVSAVRDEHLSDVVRILFG